MEDIGILLRLEGAEQALASAKQLEIVLNGMDKKTYTAKIRMANAKLGEEIAGINKALVNQGAGIRRINQSVAKSYRDRNLVARQTVARLKADNRYMTDTIRKQRAHAKFIAKQAQAEKQYLTARKNVLDQQVFDYEKTQKAFQTGLVQTGSQLQTLGNTLGRITAPFTRLFSGALIGAGFAAVNKVTEGLTSAFERYDTMETFDARLRRLGMDTSKKFTIGAGQAMTAIDNLDESVRGLPTGLDQIVSAMERYAGASGDVEKATKLAIAANNTFIAGRMDDRSILFTERQLRSLAGGAELAATQWDSLQRNAPLAMNAVAKAMKKPVKEMMDDLRKGRISGQEFLDTFIKVGTEGKIQSAAQKMKMTWSAVSQNITNAFSRMGYNVLKTLDDVFEKASGRSLLQDILGVDKNGNPILDKNGNPTGGIKNYIDNLSKGIQGWIKANPNAILDFWERLKNFDIAGTLKGFIDVVSPVAKAMGGLLSSLGGEGAGKLLGRAVIVSKGLTLVGGALKGLSKPLSVLGAKGLGLYKGAGLLGIGKLMGSLSKVGSGIKVAAFAKLSDAFRHMGDLGKADTFRKLANVTRAGKSLKGVTKAAKAMDSLQGSIIGLVNKGLNIAAIGVFAKSIDWLASAFQKIGKTDFSLEKFAGFGTAAATFIGEFALISQALGAKGVVTGIAQFSRLLGTVEIAAISKTIQSMAKAMNDIATAKMPDSSRVSRVTDSMVEFLDSLPSTDIFTSFGKKFSASAVGKIAESVSSVTKAMTDIDSLKVDLGDVRDKLFGEDGKGGEGSLIGVMDDLANASKGDWISSMVKKWDFGNLESIFNSTANMVTSLNTIITTKLKPSDIKKISGEDGVLSQLKDSLKPIVESMDELFTMPIEGESFLNTRGGKYKDWGIGNKPITTLGAKASQYANMMKSLEKAFTNIGSALGAIGRMKTTLDKRTEEFGLDKEGNLDFSSIGGAIGGIESALSPLTEGDTFTTLQRAADGFEGFDFTNIVGAFNKGIIPLITAYSRIKGIMDEAGMAFDPANPLAGGGFAIGMLISQVMGSLKAMNDAMTEIGDMATFGTNIASLDSAMVNVQSIFTKITEMQNALNASQPQGGAPAIGGAISGGLGSIGQTIKNIVQDVSEAASQAPTVMAGAMMLQVAFSSMRSAFSLLPGIANQAEQNTTTITTAINTLSAIGMRVINISIIIAGTVDDGGIPQKINQVSTRIETALNTIRPLYPKRVSVKVTGTISDGGVPARIRAIATSIWSAFNSIPTSLTRHVNVSVIGSVSKSGQFGTGLSTGGMVSANGKAIYRARGGDIFKPKGTDTVPAMLTPGEYVMRRKAVDTFGARFFQGLNHLDLKGALNALSIRAGRNILPKASTVINNNTTNNNYNNYNMPITNNANDGNVGIARAGRFLQSLQH